MVIFVRLVDAASSNQVQVQGAELEATYVSVRRWMLVLGLRLLDGSHELLQECSVVGGVAWVGNHSNCVHAAVFFHFPDGFRHIGCLVWLGVHRVSSGSGLGLGVVLALGCRHGLGLLRRMS